MASRHTQDDSDRVAPPATAGRTSMNARRAIDTAWPRRLHGKDISAGGCAVQSLVTDIHRLGIHIDADEAPRCL